jgi:hypothetical protein
MLSSSKKKATSDIFNRLSTTRAPSSGIGSTYNSTEYFAHTRGQFKAAMESHVSAWGSERTAMGRRSAMGKRTRAFPDKRTKKAGPPSSTADG